MMIGSRINEKPYNVFRQRKGTANNGTAIQLNYTIKYKRRTKMYIKL